MPRPRRSSLSLSLIILLSVAGGAGCKSRVPASAPGQASATAMGSWPQWRDLSPLVEVARGHAPETAVNALTEASALLRQGKAQSADKRLAKAADASGFHWIAVARANVAALYFTKCIRGVAWRLAEGKAPDPTDREMDFSEETRIQAGDVSVEAMLNNLEAALQSDIPALQIQARIARARVAAFAQRCSPNEQVTQMATGTVESDLATLAAEGHLTPDLAYLWAGVQMNRFSGSAARPFLLQAKEGGFDHPAVTFMLAVIALEERDFERARNLAVDSEAVYAQLGDTAGRAEAKFVLGEVERARDKPSQAKSHYDAALKLNPQHMPSMLALCSLTLASKGEAEATEAVHAQLPRLVFDGPLDAQGARDAAANLESLVILATEPPIVQAVRDALVLRIESEGDPVRRGLRYFYAAMLDVRLREYEVAQGHGVLAKEEFAQSEVPAPIDVDTFLDRLQGGA